MPASAIERDDEGRERLGHVLAQPAHVLLHVEGVVRARVAHRSRTEEQVGLEEGVREEVEDRRDPRADAEPHHHVAELADRRVREHLLDVVLHERERGADDHGRAADRGHEVHAAVPDREAREEDRVDARAEVHARDDHRRRVDERRHRRRAGHRVGQPGVQRELTALADDGEHERGRAHDQQEMVDLARQRCVVEGEDVERRRTGGALDDEVRHDDAGQQTDVAGAGGEERLERGVGVGLLLPPVPDEHERAEADELPAHEQLQRVVRDDEHEHRRGEQAQARRRSRCSAGRRACTRSSRCARAARSS